VPGIGIRPLHKVTFLGSGNNIIFIFIVIFFIFVSILPCQTGIPPASAPRCGRSKRIDPFEEYQSQETPASPLPARGERLSGFVDWQTECAPGKDGLYVFYNGGL
jgi:hypothetical protein